MLDPSNPHQDFEAKLEIRVDKEGVLSYNCDWEPGDEGLIAVASIFYKIMVDNLCSEILEEIKQQCVISDSEADYMAVINLINAQLDDQKSSSEGTSDDDVVVPPDQVFNI